MDEGLKLYMVCLFVFIYRQRLVYEILGQNASLYCDRVAIEVNLDKAKRIHPILSMKGGKRHNSTFICAEFHAELLGKPS